MPNSLRTIVYPLAYARRCTARPMPRVTGIAQRKGIAYQRRVTKVLAESIASVPDLTLLAEPWFAFLDANGIGQAVPDIVLVSSTAALVIEVKYTYTSLALSKLLGLYLPIVSQALSLPASGLVLCRNLTGEVDRSLLVGEVSLLLSRDFNRKTVAVLCWRENGGIPLKKFFGKSQSENENGGIPLEKNFVNSSPKSAAKNISFEKISGLKSGLKFRRKGKEKQEEKLFPLDLL